MNHRDASMDCPTSTTDLAVRQRGHGGRLIRSLVVVMTDCYFNASRSPSVRIRNFARELLRSRGAVDREIARHDSTPPRLRIDRGRTHAVTASPPARRTRNHGRRSTPLLRLRTRGADSWIDTADIELARRFGCS